MESLWRVFSCWFSMVLNWCFNSKICLFFFSGAAWERTSSFWRYRQWKQTNRATWPPSLLTRHFVTHLCSLSHTPGAKYHRSTGHVWSVCCHLWIKLRNINIKLTCVNDKKPSLKQQTCLQCWHIPCLKRAQAHWMTVIYLTDAGWCPGPPSAPLTHTNYIADWLKHTHTRQCLVDG